MIPLLCPRVLVLVLVLRIPGLGFASALAAPPPSVIGLGEHLSDASISPSTFKASPVAEALDDVISPERKSTRRPSSVKTASLAALEAEARRAPEVADRWVRFGDAVMQRSRETQESSGYLRAQSAFQRASELDPRNSEAFVGLAWVFNTVHDFAQGRLWAEKALALDPKHSRAHALLSDAAVELGDYENALEHCQAALDARPDLSSLSRAGHLVWMMGDARQGRLLMEKAIKSGADQAENLAWCRAQLALMLWQEGALLPAQQQVARAMQEAPRNPLVLAAAGRIRLAHLDFATAIECYQRSIAESPTHEALVGLADAYRAAGQESEAQAQDERVREFHRSGAHRHVATSEAPALEHSHGAGTGDAQLALFLADRNCQPEEAVREAELAYRNFKNVHVADTLAWCYFRAGRFEEARTTMKRALRWNTPDARLLYHAGMIQAKLGDPMSAKKLLSRALSQNPRFHPLDARVAAETLQSLSQTGPELSAHH